MKTSSLATYNTGALVFVGEREVLLTGYRLRLANKELSLLKAIIERGAVNTSGTVGYTSDSERFRSLPVLVNSINRKAKIVSGRKLVICKNRNYMLEPNM